MLLGMTSREPLPYVYGGITLYARTFQSVSTSATVYDSLTAQQRCRDGPTTPCR